MLWTIITLVENIYMNNVMKKSINTYSLPIKKRPVIAVLDLETHIKMDKFAIDFIVPENTPIVATASGKIIYTKVDSNEGGDDVKWENFKFYNHIVIKHVNGEYTEYGHLKYLGTSKKVGDLVKEGEIIGFSGNTGYSSEPHLHFSVFLLTKVEPNFETLPTGKVYFLDDPEFGFQTIEPRFKEKLNVLKG